MSGRFAQLRDWVGREVSIVKDYDHLEELYKEKCQTVRVQNEVIKEMGEELRKLRATKVGLTSGTISTFGQLADALKGGRHG